jgi:hypothetical protein
MINKILLVSIGFAIFYSCSYENSMVNDRKGERVRPLDTYSKSDTTSPNNSMNSNSSTDMTEDPRNGNGKSSGM